MNMSVTPTLAQAKRYIDAKDFSKNINKLVQQGGWKQAQALEVCEQYKNYLFLVKKYHDKVLPPSEDIDEFWHSHILDTKQYREDCRHIFGHYFDHYPYLGMDEESDLQDLDRFFSLTKSLYEAEFNTPLQSVRQKGITNLIIRFPTLIDSAIIHFTSPKLKEIKNER